MECLVLRNTTTGEADITVTVLTREGRKVEAVAKSARAMPSRMRAGLLPFSVSDVTLVAGRHNWIVRSAYPVMTFPAFRKFLPVLSGLTAVAACLVEGTVDAADPRLYTEATKILRDLHTATLAREPHRMLTRRVCAALLRVFGLLGFAPLFDRCAKCSSTELTTGGFPVMLAGLSASAGGAVCGPCASALPDSRTLSVAAFHDLRKRTIPKSSGDAQELLRFLAAFSAWHLSGAAMTLRWAVVSLIAE